MINIQHASIDEWRNGPRVDVFTIQHKLTNADGSPTMIDDPSFVQQPLEAGQVAAPVPQVQASEDFVYSMPEKANAGFSLVYLKAARTMGAEVAIAWLLELALGEDGYDALAGEADLDPATLNVIMETVQTRALGGLDAPKG